MTKAFLIAAPWSNSGKTTITLGLTRYLYNKGLDVQTFKCGPDYIDTIHHSTAAGKPSVNLDSVMMTDDHIKNIFSEYTATADISIVEGVMGLFDGAVKDKGSSAELAKKLNIPVILVVNAKAMAYTIAPILYGLKTFDPEVKIAGVLFNFVRTESHYAFLKEACETVGIHSLGYIPPNDDIAIPSRHLGLHIEDSFENLIETAADHIGKSLNVVKGLKPLGFDLEQMIENKSTHLIKGVQALELNLREEDDLTKGFQPLVTIAVAKDEAFRFTYIENLKYLEKLGNVVFFSPIHDDKIPDADMIYLAGGYPELYLESLSSNSKMKEAIRTAANKGIKILAECGGMMYLGNQIINEKGVSYSMVGIFDFSTSMENKKLHLGYRRVVIEKEEIWGHEFHYSTIHNDHYDSIAEVYTARKKEIKTKVYSYKNVWASYIHLYWGAGNFSWINKLLTKELKSFEIKESRNTQSLEHLEMNFSSDNNESLNKGLKPLGELREKEYYFVTFATAKSRISDRMVKYNSSNFIRNLDGLIFSKEDLRVLKVLFDEAVELYQLDVSCFNILPDHVHFLLKVEDEKELNEQIRKLKGYTSFKFQRHKEWERGEQKVWVQKFHRKKLSKLDNSIEKVTNYIKNNHYKHKERWGEEMTLFIESLHNSEN
ncbi:cobyrinic acid a,c-diamide synthase [Tenacibaculum sp. MAR_2009_124]|uniref:cobyrinate a,c-diamide synthase n=1 Tax=Tenacibaculum sp. MAR_2009_124 TaxID=1250059 RepID=UPI000899B6A8|nr:cobyrinate a,c-diamide synthase [Tenacibaculum sp. MAR_2009_124]SEB86123.1 cobyrinic acid a,c-diamide synthase [Tenacibaculum sp. MAR_2009_124]